VFLWSGEEGYIPVWNTSCSPADDPPPSYGLSACNVTDGTTPAWSPDMSGRVVGDAIEQIGAGRTRITIPLDAGARERLARDGSALISFETPAGEVQALDLRLSRSRD
jgi:hypothetical protein